MINLRTGIVVLTAIIISACSVVRQVEEAKRFARCEFRIAGVSKSLLGQVDIQNVRKLSDLSLKKAAKVGDVLTSKSIPFTFDLNLQARNPNTKPASMNKLEWTLFVDGREMSKGILDEKVIVNAGESADFAIHIEMDLRKIMSGDSREAMTNVVFNVAGSGNEPTAIMLRVKPWIDVEGYLIEYPGTIDIRTEFTSEQGRELRKGIDLKSGK